MKLRYERLLFSFLSFDTTRLLKFLDAFEVQTAYLQADTKLTLLQQSCIGKWPNSVLSMEKAKFTPETTAQQELDSFISALKSSFADPPEVQRRQLASEVLTMKQRTTELIDRFAFRFKNNIHRLSKLNEPVDRNSPHDQFVMSYRFIPRTKPDIQKHLVLKAEEYKDLSEIVEAAKRIKRSFSPVHSPPKPPPISPNTLATNPTSVTARGRGIGLRCQHCGSAGHLKSSCPEKNTEKQHLRHSKPKSRSVSVMEQTPTLSLYSTGPIMQILSTAQV